MSDKTSKTRRLTATAMLAAVATVLMFINTSVPMLMPGFIKLDLSELPGLIASFAMGPLYGMAVCAVKNLLNLFFTNTAGVGELSNFLLGTMFVVPAGLIYRVKKTRLSALIGALTGAVFMAAGSLLTNYYIVYPFYIRTVMPLETILNAYRAINPNVETLWDALLLFNLPFTFVKGMLSALISFPVYKHISFLIKREAPAKK